jgi:hypothetical protein
LTEIDREALVGRWLHSHEEDTDDTRVFRPADFDFPPARGREGFELRDDGSGVELRPGPTDRPEQVEGSWELEGDQLKVGDEKLDLVSADPERLVARP